jgi:hypothetical protein
MHIGAQQARRQRERQKKALAANAPFVANLPDEFAGQLTLEGSCWRWHGEHGTNGRPVCGNKEAGTRDYVYRVLYRVLRSQFSDDLVLHHGVCHHEWCANPWHTEPLTQSDHMRAHGSGPETCKNGHPWTEESTYIWKARGWRRCRVCRRKGNK